MAWLPTYTYRKEITLSRASGAVTNYQMKLLVGESSGASGEDVDCNTHCLSNFNDIRFTTSDGLTQLDYWIESISGTTPNQLATIWIEFDSIGTGATTFYMYYGNAGASPVSNGVNTFIVFDDFERGNDGDTVGGDWTETIPHCHISTEQKYGGSRSMKLVGFPTASPMATIATIASANISIRFRLYKDAAAYAFFNHSDGTTWAHSRFTNGAKINVYDGDNYIEVGSMTADAWQLMEFNDWDWTGKTVDVWCQDIKVKNNADISYAAGGLTNAVRMDGINVVTQDSWIDDFIVRNWRATEPAWGSWGSEESGSQALTASLADGIKLAEVRSNILTIVRSFTDGVKFADIILDYSKVKFLSDGIKFADAKSTVWDIIRLYSDKIKLSDIQDIVNTKFLSLNDIIAFSDAKTYNYIINRLLSDGIKLSETHINNFVLIISDGFKLVESVGKHDIIVLMDVFNLSDSKQSGWKADLADIILFNEDRVRGIVYHSGKPITTTEVSGAFTEWSGIKRPYDLLIKSFWTKRAKV